MHTEANRILARRWFEEGWNRRADAIIDEMLDPQAVGFMEGRIVEGTEAFRAARAELLKAFSNMSIAIEDTVAEGNWVVVRWRLKGTHNGSLFGNPASGRSVDIVGTTWLHFENGKITKGHDTWNQASLLAPSTRSAG